MCEWVENPFFKDDIVEDDVWLNKQIKMTEMTNKAQVSGKCSKQPGISLFE